MTIDMGMLPGWIASSRPAAGTPTLGGAAQPVDRISAGCPGQPRPERTADQVTAELTPGCRRLA